MLSSLEGFITLSLEGDIMIRSAGYMWNVLRKFFPENLIDCIKGMTMLATNKGVIFDIPTKNKDIFLLEVKNLESNGLRLFEPKTLPEVNE